MAILTSSPPLLGSACTTTQRALASHDASMASIVTLDRPELPTKAEGENGVQERSGIQGPTAKDGSEDTAVTTTYGQATDSIPPSPSPGSGLVPLRSASLNGTAPGASSTPPLSAPQPKKFSHVNINKKFLEKTSSTPSSGPSTSTLSSAKVGTAPRTCSKIMCSLFLLTLYL